MMLAHNFRDFLNRYIEEFLSLIHPVDPPVTKFTVQRVLQSGGVFREDDRIHIEMKGHRGVTQFTNTIHRVEAARHSDLVDVLAERADVRDDVNVTGPRQLRLCNGTLSFRVPLRRVTYKTGAEQPLKCSRLYTI